jgi:hypothetical protein
MSVFAILGSGTISGAFWSHSLSDAISGAASKSSSLVFSKPSKGKGALCLSVHETMRADRMVQMREIIWMGGSET